MGFFDFFRSKPLEDKQTIDRRSVPGEEINRMQQTEASPSYCKKVYRKFYSDYPEMPFVSQDREINTGWLTQTTLSSNLVKREMMTRYDDGLLPGHVYLLYWLGKGRKKRIPAYFEYEYGIFVQKEIQFLTSRGYLDADGKPTVKGQNAVNAHHEVIDARHPAPEKTSAVAAPAKKQSKTGRCIPSVMPEGTKPVPKQDIPLLRTEFAYINQVIRQACKLGNVRASLLIEVDCFHYGLDFHGTHYEWTPKTPTGKPSKYPLKLRFEYRDTGLLPAECAGELYYLQGGNIGKARLIFWRRNIGYFIYLGQSAGSLAIKKVIRSEGTQHRELYSAR